MIYNQFIHYIVDHLLSKRVLFIYSVIGKKLRRQKRTRRTLEKNLYNKKHLATHQCKKGNNLNAPFRKNNILQLTERFITFDDLIKNLACNYNNIISINFIMAYVEKIK